MQPRFWSSIKQYSSVKRTSLPKSSMVNSVLASDRAALDLPGKLSCKTPNAQKLDLNATILYCICSRNRAVKMMSQGMLSKTTNLHGT